MVSTGSGTQGSRVGQKVQAGECLDSPRTVHLAFTVASKAKDSSLKMTSDLRHTGPWQKHACILTHEYTHVRIRALTPCRVSLVSHSLSAAPHLLLAPSIKDVVLPLSPAYKALLG